MARILVVDDRPVNREYLVTLLRYSGHETVEAADGEEALAAARAAPPDLVLTDIVMPRMDGVALVRALRDDPALAAVPVVFVTATFRWRSARDLARVSGVRWVLAKPVEPETMLATVDEALGRKGGASAPGRVPAPPPDSATLLRMTEDYQIATARLAALVDQGMEMASETDIDVLLDRSCDAARAILGAEFAVLGIPEDGEGDGLRRFTAWRGSRRYEEVPRPPAHAGVLGKILRSRRPVRLADVGGHASALGLTQGHPPVRSFLGVPLGTRTAVLGWLYLANSSKETGFTEDDERILSTIASQVAVAYDNARLHTEAMARTAELEREVTAHQTTQEKVLERNRILELSVDIGAAVADSSASSREVLRTCCEAVVRRLDAAFARIWILDATRTVLELKASAGMYTHLDGPHGRVPVGKFKIGLIAEERQPHFTNDVLNDPRVSDREWARREGMVAFAGYPLLVGDDLIGVLAMFAKHPLGEGTLLGLRFVSDTVATGIRRRHEEVARRESDERFRQLAESIHEAFWLMDAKTGAVIYASPATAEIWGRPAGDLSSQEAWMSTVHPEDRERMAQESAPESQRDTHEWVYRIVRPDKSIRWIRDRAFPVRNAAGAVVRIAGLAEDITELRRTEEQLQQAMKMEAIGRLAGGVAHDFNNLLTVITGYSDLALMKTRDDPKLTAHIAEVKKAGVRAGSLVHQLLAFSRKSPASPRVIDLNAVVASMHKMLQRLIGEDIALKEVLAPDLGPVRADLSQMEQVVMNLAVNARDAMPGGGSLTLETSNADVGPGDIGGRMGLVPGHYALLALSDTGIGMDAAVMARIFEPFFTTKGEGKGTGLGLATVYGIVKQSGGGISVYSEPGQGTTFKVYLPRIESAADQEERAEQMPAVRGGTETILLVEDNEQLRGFSAEVLRDHGYRVLEASSPAEALGVAGKRGSEIHLMVTDVVMPGMSGGTLAARLAPICPRMKILFVSGYTAGAAGQHAIPEDGVHFLPKPFSPEALARRVREILDMPAK